MSVWQSLLPTFWCGFGVSVSMLPQFFVICCLALHACIPACLRVAELISYLGNVHIIFELDIVRRDEGTGPAVNRRQTGTPANDVRDPLFVSVLLLVVSCVTT